jgi:hypothetical protein
MIVKIRILFLGSILLLFSGCSWQEYFVITNETTSEIIIDYEIEIPGKGFAIFGDKPSGYRLNASNNIDWDKMLLLIDGNMDPQFIQIVLPPGSAIIIGTLPNDHYEKQGQYYINGRNFDLKYLKIASKNKVVEISPEKFDSYFKKKDGCIVFRMK